MKIGSKVGIGKRLWLDCNFILFVDLGSFDFLAKIFREIYCEGIFIYFLLYVVLEGLLGFNIWLKNYFSRYLLVVQFMFFEFIFVEYFIED